LVKNGDTYETRRIAIASTNDKMVALDESVPDGLSETEQVVLSPRAHLHRFDFSAFPELEDAEQVVVTSPRGPTDLPPADDSRSDVDEKAPDGSTTEIAEGVPTSDRASSNVGRRPPGPDLDGVASQASSSEPMVLGKGHPLVSFADLESVPEDVRDRMASADANGDGSIDLRELSAAMALESEPAGNVPRGSGGGE
jgi:hypothetical protein